MTKCLQKQRTSSPTSTLFFATNYLIILYSGQGAHFAVFAVEKQYSQGLSCINGRKQGYFMKVGTQVSEPMGVLGMTNVTGAVNMHCYWLNFGKY